MYFKKFEEWSDEQISNMLDGEDVSDVDTSYLKSLTNNEIYDELKDVADYVWMDYIKNNDISFLFTKFISDGFKYDKVNKLANQLYQFTVDNIEEYENDVNLLSNKNMLLGIFKDLVKAEIESNII